MARVCEICGKGPTSGRHIVRKGLEKKKGGIGLHTTGISKRRFLPNVQKIRVRDGNTVSTKRVCTSCIKAGKIVKAVS